MLPGYSAPNQSTTNPGVSHAMFICTVPSRLSLCFNFRWGPTTFSRAYVVCPAPSYRVSDPSSIGIPASSTASGPSVLRKIEEQQNPSWNLSIYFSSLLFTQEVDLRALGAACNIPVDFINYLRKFISESRILACFNSYISLVGEDQCLSDVNSVQKKSPEPLIDAARVKSAVPLRFIIHLIQQWGDDGRHLFGGYEHYVQVGHILCL